MQKKQALKLLRALFVYSFGLVTYCVFVVTTVWNGSFFHRASEKEVLERQLGRVYSR